MTVMSETSPSANDTESGVVRGKLRATRVIADSVCRQVMVLSSFTS